MSAPEEITGLPEPSPKEHSSSWLGKLHPYFRDPEHVLVLKLDTLLLTWAFIAGLLKDMDQSGTTQAYVSGMKQELNMQGTDFNVRTHLPQPPLRDCYTISHSQKINTFFTCGYIIGMIPSPSPLRAALSK